MTSVPRFRVIPEPLVEDAFPTGDGFIGPHTLRAESLRRGAEQRHSWQSVFAPLELLYQRLDCVHELA